VQQKAWDAVVQTFLCSTEEVQSCTFTAGILTPIINLTSEQQIELVTDLATETINKNKFKTLAENSHLNFKSVKFKGYHYSFFMGGTLPYCVL